MSVQANQIRLKPSIGLATADDLITRRATLLGVGVSDSNMGTGFVNIPGANSQDLRAVLLAIDGAIVNATTITNNLTTATTGTALDASQGKILKDRADIVETNVIGIASGTSDMGAMTSTIYTDGSNVKTLLEEVGSATAALVTLSGVAANATNLGTIGGTGTVVADNGTVKTAVESLDTAATNMQSLIGLGAGDQFAVATFTGSTIGDAGGDARTVRQALQDLETFVEGIVTGIKSAGGWDATGALPGVFPNNSILRVTTPGATSVATVDGPVTDWVVGDQLLKDDAGNLYKIDNTDNPDLSALRTLTGTASLATDLGTFSGGTIVDNSSIKVALQALETALESNVHSVINSLVSTSTTNSLSALQGKNLKDEQDNITSAVGQGAGNTHMGVYTGSIITDNQTAKQNIQELETAIEANATGIRVNRLVNSADIAASGAINIDGTTANTTLTAEGTAVATLGASAGAFNADPEIQVYVNGVMAEKGVDVIWASATSFTLPIDWYTGGHIQIIETNKNLA